MCVLLLICSAEDVKHDRYAVAAADTELGLLYIDMGRLEEAERILEATKYVHNEMELLIGLA